MNHPSDKRRVPDHPQTRIEHDGFSAEVDVEIAPLLLELWKLGCRTLNSCQDNFGKVWIQFDDSVSAELFCSIAAGAFDQVNGSLYSRVLGWGDPDPDREWRYDSVPDDLNVEWEEWDGDGRTVGPPQVVFSLSVRFPRSDLREVERRLRDRRENG